MRPRPSGVLSWWRSARPLLTLVDALAVVLAGLVVLPAPGGLPLVGAALAALLVCRGADLYRPRLVLSVLDDLPALLVAVLAAGAVLIGLSPTLGTGNHDLQAVALAAAVAFAAAVLLRTAVYAGTHLLRHAGVLARPVLVVGTGAIGRRLTDALLTRREHGLLPVGLVDTAPRAGTRNLPLPLVCSVDEVDEVMGELGVQDVVFAFPGPPDEETVAAVRACLEHDRQVFVVPRFFEVMGTDRAHRTEVVRDIAVVRLRRSGLPPLERLARRAVDVAVALAGIVVLSPVLLAVAVAVRLETGPGVIFHQTRVGDGSRTYVLLKFRTLRPAAFGDDETTWEIDTDSRRGPVGRFLRRTGLDALPQLVNVLRGELSLAGPRPEAGLVADDRRPHASYGDARRPAVSLRDVLGPRWRSVREAASRRRRPALPRHEIDLSGRDVPPPDAGRPEPDRELTGSRRG